MSDVQYHPEKRYSCNGIEINADSFGDPTKPPVVLIMGLATQLIHWDEEFCKSLAKRGFWVVRFDNRDIGKSTILKGAKAPNFWQLLSNRFFKSPLPVPYKLMDMAKDVIGLMDALEIEKAHIVGVSMGGMIAQLLAIHYPLRVKTLTSIMSGTGNKKLMQPRLGISLKVLNRSPANPEEHIEQGLGMWRLLHGNSYPFEHERIRNTISKALQRGYYPGGVFRQISAIADADERTEHLRKVNIPSLVIHGDQDPLVRLPNGLLTAESIPNSKLKVIKGMGHTLPRETWGPIIADIEELTKP